MLSIQTGDAVYLELISAPSWKSSPADFSRGGRVTRGCHERGSVDDQGLDADQHFGQPVAGNRALLRCQREAGVELVHVAQGVEGIVALRPSFHVVQLGFVRFVFFCGHDKVRWV